MAASRDWTTYESAPAGTDYLNTGDDEIRATKVDIRERMAVDHVWGASVGTDGYHKRIAFPDQGTDPTTITGIIQLYGKIVGGKTEIFAKTEDGTVIQLTTLGALNGGGFGGLGSIPSGAGTIPSVNIDTGTTVGKIVKLGSGYVFVVSGVSTLPTAGAVYTNNSVSFTVTSATATLVYATGASAPLTSGTLTKSSGTGDATLTFSAVTASLPAVDASLLLGLTASTQYAIVTGTCAHAATIPLPSGYTQDQCQWMVGQGSTSGGGYGLTDFQCTVNSSRVVTCYYSVHNWVNSGSSSTAYGTANYIIIGAK